jgi:hypothetical protein
MNSLVRDYYRTGGAEETVFHQAIFLTESQESWEELDKKSSGLSQGWFELCRLPLADRIEFVRDFWMNMLPYQPAFHLFISDFFERLDDLGVVLSQSSKEAPWVAEMVYSLKENRSFFRGLLPCKEADLEEFKNSIHITLPRDYLAFLRIHNGFGKLSELGLMRVDQVREARESLTEQLMVAERPLMLGTQMIDPDSLIPFYESFGLASYQCFFADWYPGNEMGNVYLSGIDYTISDYMDRKGWADHLAFPTFLEWLAFYLAGNSLD